MSRREAARVFGIDRRTVDKVLKFSIPPGYRRTKPVHRPKLDPFVGIIDAILETDKSVPKKQKHTSKRVFERLRDEHGFTGGITIVKDYIFAAKQRQQLRHGIEHIFPDEQNPLELIFGSVGFSYRTDFDGNGVAERFFEEDRLIGNWRPWFNIDSER